MFESKYLVGNPETKGNAMSFIGSSKFMSSLQAAAVKVLCCINIRGSLSREIELQLLCMQAGGASYHQVVGP